MKKVLSLFLAFVMLTGCVFAFSSCFNRPELDIDDAEDALEDEDYIVSIDDDPSDPMYKQTLRASDAEGEEYLYIIWFDSAAVAKLYYKNLKLEREQEIESLKLEIKTLKKVIKLYDDEYKSEELDELEDELKELEKELKDLKKNKDEVFGRSGKVVWRGTPKAIKESKGK